jgi:hypothetical protein
MMFLAAILGIGGMIWVRNAEDSLNQEIRPLIEQGQCAEALNRLETTTFPGALFRGGWREDIQAAWLAHLEKLAQENPTGEATREAVQDYLKHFPQHEVADRICGQSLSQLAGRTAGADQPQP